jgi:hypothetical protein
MKFVNSLWEVQERSFRRYVRKTTRWNWQNALYYPKYWHFKTDFDLRKAYSNVKNLHICQRVCSWILCHCQNKIICFPKRYWLVRVTDMNGVLCVVRTDFFCVIEMAQAVCHQQLKAWVLHLFQDSQGAICFGGCNTGTGFLLINSVSPRL